MKLTCPACGALYSLDALLGNEGAREAVMAALQLPAPLGWHMIRYLALFRPAKRNLTLDRLANLINELLPMITEARITRNGNLCSAPQDYWRMAMDEMIAKRDNLTLPLKSHGYLLTIIEGYSLKAEQRKEQQHEDRLAGRTPVGRDLECAGTTAQASVMALPGSTETARVFPHNDAAKAAVAELKVAHSKVPRSTMPQSVKDILNSSKTGDTNGHTH